MAEGELSEGVLGLFLEASEASGDPTLVLDLRSLIKPPNRRAASDIGPMYIVVDINNNSRF